MLLYLLAIACLVPLVYYGLTWYRLLHRTVIVGIVGQMPPPELPHEITSLLSKGLTTLSDNGQPQPQLVESWEATEGGKQYTLRLAKGLYWHDGKPLFSDNVPLAVPDVQVSYPDSYTLRLALKEPFAPLVALLSKPTLRGNGLVGLGDYRVRTVRLDANNRLTELEVERFRGSYERVLYKFYENEKSATTAMRMGEVDILGTFADLKLEGVRVIKMTSPTSYKKVVALLFNTKDPLLEDKGTRQGLSHLLSIDGSGEEATGPIPPSSWAYTEVKRVRDNSEQGKRLLEKKMSQLQRDGITIMAPPHLEHVARGIALQWQSFDINARVTIERGKPQGFQAYLTMLDIPPEADQYSMWHSSQTTNLTGYNSKRVDKALEDGRRNVDEEARKKSYAEFQRYLVEDAPALFLYYPRYLIYYNQRVQETDALRLKRGSLQW